MYIHGFGSGAKSRKGSRLVEYMQNHYNILLHLPDYNVPSFNKLTITNALNCLTEYDTTIRKSVNEEFKWRLIGSSLGGYLGCLWAEMYPDRVDKLFLLCPAFDLQKRWISNIGPERLNIWKTSGEMSYMYLGKLEPLHYKFMEDMLTYTNYPNPTCEILIIHGEQDPVVSIDVSRKFIETHSNAKLLTVQDNDHELIPSLPIIQQNLKDYFNLMYC